MGVSWPSTDDEAEVSMYPEDHGRIVGDERSRDVVNWVELDYEH